jgi:hypothetical protein
LTESERLDGVIYDIVVMLQPTSPLRRAEHVQDTIDMLIDGDWDAVWTRESSSFADLNSTIYVLNDGNHNYASFNAQTSVGLGMTKDVQVGQGFWVQSAASSWPSMNTFTLKPEDRVHSNAAFLKDNASGVLSLTVQGNNSQDIFNIMFRDFGTAGYDRFIDVYKWDSPYEEATEMWTIAEDQSRLSSNVQGPLGNTHTEIQAAFKCSAMGEYEITASDIKKQTSFKSKDRGFLPSYKQYFLSSYVNALSIDVPVNGCKD